MRRRREDYVRQAYGGDEPFGKEYLAYAQKALEERLREDGSIDITTEALLRKRTKVAAVIRAKQDGVLAGLEEILVFYARHQIDGRALVKDGDRFRKGEILAELEGPADELLRVERTGLNILERMSGIATRTRRIVEVASSYGVQIVGTRKTILNLMDKRAVVLGGGLPHRMGLHDAILIKDNHLQAIRTEGVKDEIQTAIERACLWNRRKRKGRFVEIEVSTPEEALKAARLFKEVRLALRSLQRGNSSRRVTPREGALLGEGFSPCIIMLDNMSPQAIRKTIEALKREGLFDDVLLEASGSIHENNVEAYARTGVDAISMGSLTLSARALDMNQKFVSRELFLASPKRRRDNPFGSDRF